MGHIVGFSGANRVGISHAVRWTTKLIPVLSGLAACLVASGSSLSAPAGRGGAQIVAGARGAVVLASADSRGRAGSGDSFSPVWAPNGESLMFTSFSGSFAAGVSDQNRGGFVKNLRSGSLVRIKAASPSDQAVSPVAWSSNGQTIFFEGGQATYSRDIHNKKLRTEAPSAVALPSPDGKWVAFTDTSNEQLRAYVRNRTTGKRKLITTRNGVPFRDSNGPEGFAWSPDGSKLAFSVEAVGEGLLTWNSRTGTTSVLDPHGEQPTWSPDGTRIAYVDRGTFAVVIRSIQSGQRQIFAENGMSPAWSPDGTRIAFLRYRNTKIVDVFVRRVKGGRAVLASASASGVPGNGRIDQVVWSPDSTRLAFGSSAHNLLGPSKRTAHEQIFVKTVGR